MADAKNMRRKQLVMSVTFVSDLFDWRNCVLGVDRKGYNVEDAPQPAVLCLATDCDPPEGSEAASGVPGS